MVIDAESVWTRIVDHSGETFYQLRGRPFTYQARGRTIYLDTTNRMISRTAIEKALERVPINGPGEVHDLSAPSYIFGILMDDRIRRSNW